MTEAVQTASKKDAGGLGDSYIGRIPVRNVWLLLLYASDLFQLRGKACVGLENSPDDLPDLVAEMLAAAVEERQRRHLSVGYQACAARLNRVRGRIDILATERHQLLRRGLVACRFDNLTMDTPRNRFVRWALEVVSRLVRRHKLRRRCRRLAENMKSIGVSGSPPTLHQMSCDRFGRHDADDRYMVAAARLALDLALPTEASGPNVLALPNREERWARRLFERAVGGFYRVVLSTEQWRVKPGGILAWQIEESTPGVNLILPNMRTDIVLDHRLSGRRLVIDTKFTSILKYGWHRDETLSSAYMYQIYAYLRSQVGRGDRSADHAEGLLLHPAVGESVDETAIIQGHRIRFATVDLATSTSEIRDRLLQVIHPAVLVGPDNRDS